MGSEHASSVDASPTPLSPAAVQRRRCVAIVGASHRQFRLSPLVHFFLDPGTDRGRKEGKRNKEEMRVKRQNEGGEGEEREKE